MIFQVECGSRNRYSDIIDALEKNNDYHIVYKGQDKMNPIAMLFECDDQDFDKVSRYAEKLIKATRYGRMISFRIVPQGSVVYYKK